MRSPLIRMPSVQADSPARSVHLDPRNQTTLTHGATPTSNLGDRGRPWVGDWWDAHVRSVAFRVLDLCNPFENWSLRRKCQSAIVSLFWDRTQKRDIPLGRPRRGRFDADRSRGDQQYNCEHNERSPVKE
jgi:hypothetical protein